MSKLQVALQGKAEVTPYEKFRYQVEKLRPEIASLCGKDNVHKFIRVCMNAVQSTPEVLEADRKTLLLACLKAAQDNLLPDGREAVFNIYNTRVKDKANNTERWEKRVQYMPMSYGLIQLIYASGATYVDGVPVYAMDEFEYQRGDDPKIVHRPYKGTDDPGEVVAAYVVVKMPTGEIKREVMFRRDIERVRSKSKAPDGLMWKDFYDQGAVKSVVHRICKQLPRAARLERALAHDNEVVGLSEVQAPGEESSDLSALIDTRIEKVTDPKTAPAKGDAGTLEIKNGLIEKMKAAKDKETLDVVMDNSRFYKWDAADAAHLEAEFNACLKGLGA